MDLFFALFSPLQSFYLYLNVNGLLPKKVLLGNSAVHLGTDSFKSTYLKQTRLVINKYDQLIVLLVFLANF